MRTVAQVYKYRIISAVVVCVVFVAALVSAVLLSTAKLDRYVTTMYQGNIAPVWELDEMRVAEMDARREFWKLLHTRDVAAQASSIRAIRADLERVDAAWSLYYPSGVSSPQERELAESIKRDLPRFRAVIEQGVSLFVDKGDDASADWVTKNVSFLVEIDAKVGRNIAINVNQARDFATRSSALCNMFIWASAAILSMVVIAGVAITFYLSRRGDAARSESRYQSWLANRVVEHSANGCMITDHKGIIQKVNPAFTQLTGYTQSEVLGRNPGLLSSGRQSPEFYQEFWRCLQENGRWEGELWNRRKDGGIYLEWLSIAGVRDQRGRYSHYVAIMSDSTQRHLEGQNLNRLATHDALTDLPNRLLLDERLQQAITRAKRRHKKVAVMFFDLDGFKQINDSRGHSAGDLVLKVVATRLKEGVRESDTVARLGGDEFVVVLEDIDGTGCVEPIVCLLVASVGRPIDVDDQEALVTPSVGISVYPDDGKDPAELLERADCAMYEAKNSGKNGFRYFNELTCW